MAADASFTINFLFLLLLDRVPWQSMLSLIQLVVAAAKKLERNNILVPGGHVEAALDFIKRHRIRRLFEWQFFPTILLRGIAPEVAHSSRKILLH